MGVDTVLSWGPIVLLTLRLGFENAGFNFQHSLDFPANRSKTILEELVQCRLGANYML